ncbi:MAG: hypothetical protein FWG58_04770 [Methanomassiliicoccaceae archaeon]|nr:hypothetical protein [Methanomassiliicoccaceae archaeon]
MAETDTAEHVYADLKKKTVTWPEYISAEKYEHQIYRLQNEAGLSFKEARAVLTPPQMIKALAEEWGCSCENIYNLIRYGMKKVDKIANGEEDKIEDLVPTRMSYIM